MKRILWIGIVACAGYALLLPGIACGETQKRLGQAVFSVHKVDHGARVAGMGGAFTAIADDIGTIFVNPAGLTNVEDREYTLGYTRWLVDTRFYSGALAYNTTRGVVGLAVTAFSVPDVEETTIYQPIGTGRMLEIGDFSIGGSYATKLTDKLSFGFQVRWTQETIDVDKLTGVDVNFGTTFNTGFRSLRLGMAFKNLGKDIKAREINYQMPVAFDFGFAMEVFGEKGSDPSYLTLTGESHYATDYSEPRYRIGGELWLQNAFALRAGVKPGYDTEVFSVGLGLKVKPVEGKVVRVDFAYSDGNDFEPPLRFSLSGSF